MDREDIRCDQIHFDEKKKHWLTSSFSGQSLNILASFPTPEHKHGSCVGGIFFHMSSAKSREGGRETLIMHGHTQRLRTGKRGKVA